MMKKNTSKDAQIARMQQLADVKGTRVHENRNSLGTLIDFKRGADKVAYGIVKENHQYFIKKANNQGDPNVEDFAYIGGLENVTEYRYNKLSEADKNRNMLLLTINEALGGKEVVTKSGSKPSLLSEGEKPTFEKGVKPDFGKKKDKDEDKKDEKKEEKDEEEKEGKEHEKKESPEFEKGEKEEEKEEAEEEKKEDVDEGVEDEIASAEEKLASAEEKTAEEPDVPAEEPDVPAEEPDAPAEEPLDIDAIDVDAEAPVGVVDAETAVDGGEEEMAVDGGEEETAVDAEMAVDGGEEEVVDTSLEGDPETADPEGSSLFQDSEEKRIIDSDIGKLAEKLGKEEFSKEEVESAVGRLLDPLKKEFAKMDIDTKKDIADENILKIKPEEGGETPEDQLQMSDIQGQEDANMEMEEGRSCNECGFAKYAESRGYNAESLMECSVDEMASLMNGYAMENEEMGDEDLESMAVFHSDELAECLKEEYANEELTTHLEPFVKKINEVEDTSKKKADTVKGMFWWQIEPQKEKDATLKTLTEAELAEYGAMSEEQLAELDENTLNELNLAGLGNVGKFLGRTAKQGVQNVGQGVKNVAQNVKSAVTNKIDQVTSQLDQFGNQIAQEYQKGVKSTIDAKLTKAAQKFGELVNKLDAASQKAGDGPLNKQAYIMALQGVLKGAGVQEGMDGNDPLNVQTQPMMEGEEEEIEVEKPEGGEEEVFDVTKHQEPEMDMTAGFETLGAGIPKPDGAETTSVEITKDSVNVTLSESEQKVRNYIRNRLEEMAGKKKPSLNEDKKSASLKKLDKMIESQVALFESVVEEGDFGKNIANFAGKMSQRIGGDIRRQRQLKQALPTIANDEHAISQWIRDIFSGGHVHKSAASYIGRATPEAKLDILTQVANDPNGVGMLQANQMGELVYKPVDHTAKIG